MRTTRRYWASVGITGLLAIAAIILAQPFLLAGALGLAAWLLAYQYLFVRTIRQLTTRLQIDQTVTQTHGTVDEPITTLLTVTRTGELTLPIIITATAGTPLECNVSQSTPQCTLTGDDTETSTTFTVTCPVAGQAEFTDPTVNVTDAHGLFETTFTHSERTPPTITIRPQQPAGLHVGEGGDPIRTAIGEHPGDQQASGLEPASVREYTPGDPLRQIDWNATARSLSLYVRQFDQRTEHETAMFIDHRETMGTGNPGETKLAYAKQVALALLEKAQSDGDPVGLYAIGDAGVTTRHPPKQTMKAFSTLRTILHDLTPTNADGSASPSDKQPASKGTDLSKSLKGAAHVSPTPGTARDVADILASETTDYARRLEPFFSARQTYVQRIATQPLFRTVRAYLTTGGGTARNLTPDHVVILTDDTNPAEVREAVNVARRHCNHVLVFLTPSVFFEPTGLSTIEHAYERYTDFEDFRQTLVGLDDVSAFEVAPSDRLATLQNETPANITSR